MSPSLKLLPSNCRQRGLFSFYERDKFAKKSTWMFREYRIFSLKAAAADINCNKVISRPPFESHSWLGVNPSMLDLRRTGRCLSIFFNAVHGHFLKYIKTQNVRYKQLQTQIVSLEKLGSRKNLK